MQQIRSMQIRETTERAEINREAEECRWQGKLAQMLAELHTAQEKEEIERRIEKEKEDQESKRKMWKAIQKAREERIHEATPVLCKSNAEAPNMKFLDAGVKLLRKTLPGDEI